MASLGFLTGQRSVTLDPSGATLISSVVDLLNLDPSIEQLIACNPHSASAIGKADGHHSNSPASLYYRMRWGGWSSPNKTRSLGQICLV